MDEEDITPSIFLPSAQTLNHRLNRLRMQSRCGMNSHRPISLAVSHTQAGSSLILTIMIFRQALHLSNIVQTAEEQSIDACLLKDLRLLLFADQSGDLGAVLDGWVLGCCEGCEDGASASSRISMILGLIWMGA